MIEYSFYREIYGGSLIEAEDWIFYEKQAAAQLARYQRLYTVKEPLAAPAGSTPAPSGAGSHAAGAICAMADVFARFDAVRQGGPVASASIGSVSVSYAAGAGEDLSPAGQSRALYRAAAQYLDIYRGVRPPCEG